MTDSATQKEDEIKKRAEGAVGKVLREKWRLDRLVGIGGMAAVYASTHRNGKRAAVKVLHPEAALAPTVKDRFLREGYLANKVEHPGAVSILDDDVDVDGTVFLVMELLLGESLDSRLSRSGSRIPASEILQIVDQVLDCLIAAHDKGIVHRDLKPGNLFVTDGGAVKILDFGIARLEEVGQTRPGGTGSQTLGTPGFMPPEQARGRWDEVDAQSDLWAVGAVMFAALTGKHVHEAATVNEQLLAAMTVPAVKLLEAVKEAPEPIARVVDAALAFSKADRFPNARAMRAAVREAYEAIEGKPLAQAPRLSVRPPSVSPVSTNAATLDSVEALASVTTARPVIHTERRPRSSGRLKIAVASSVAALALLVFLISRSKPEEPKTVSPASATPSATAAGATGSVEAAQVGTAAPVAPVAPPSASAVPEASSTAAPAPLQGKAAPESKKIAPAPPRAAKAPAAGAPAAAAAPSDVDIFTKRR